MGLIGMLHYRKHPSDSKKAYPFAAVAKMEGIEFFYFTYHAVNFEENFIQGWVYEQGEWIEKQFDFPDVIINISSPRTKGQSLILKKLKEIAAFTSYPVGHKMKVYKRILKGEQFAEYLIPSIKVKSFENVLPVLNDYHKIVLKPLSGNHGKKIIFIESEKESYKVLEGSEQDLLDQSELNSFVNNIINSQSYLVQPFIECKTKTGLAYDFRLHVQKNGKGEWEVTLIYPRISGSSKMISNISSGGYRGELEPFLIEEFGDQGEMVKQSLEAFAISFSSHFDTLYKHPFDELGIDVGMDGNQHIWIYEVNWRPGSRHREFEVAKRLIPYCKFLMEKKT